MPRRRFLPRARLGERLHVAVVAVAAAVEHGLGRCRRLGALGEQLAGALGALGFAELAQLGLVPVDRRERAPATSSISCAEMPWLERNTEIRGRSAVPETFARTRRRRLSRARPW